MRVIGILLIATTVVNALSSTTNIDNTDVSNNNGVVGLDEVYQRRVGKLCNDYRILLSLSSGFVHIYAQLSPSLQLFYPPIQLICVYSLLQAPRELINPFPNYNHPIVV